MEYFPPKIKSYQELFGKYFIVTFFSNFDLRSKFKSLKVGHRFFCVLILFRGPFLTIDDPEGI